MTPEFHPLDHLPTTETDDFWLSLYLLNLDISHKVVTEFIPEQNHYYIDHYASDVVEFSRSALIEDRFARGRVYAEFYSHFDENTRQWVKKDQELIKWFERLVRWVRKNFRKEDWLIYTGPGAQKLLDSGNFIMKWDSMQRRQTGDP